MLSRLSKSISNITNIPISQKIYYITLVLSLCNERKRMGKKEERKKEKKWEKREIQKEKGRKRKRID